MSNCDTHPVVGGGVCSSGMVMGPPPPTEPSYSQSEKNHVDLGNAYPDRHSVELNGNYMDSSSKSLNGEETSTGYMENTPEETRADYASTKENGQMSNHNPPENYHVNAEEIARKEMFLREEIKREGVKAAILDNYQQQALNPMQQVPGKEMFLASPVTNVMENGKEVAAVTNESYRMDNGAEVDSKDMYMNGRAVNSKDANHLPSMASGAESFNPSAGTMPIPGKEMFLTENSDRSEKTNSESAVNRNDSSNMQMMNTDKDMCAMDSSEDRKDVTLQQQQALAEGFPNQMQMMGKEMFMAGNEYARQNYLMGQMEASRGNTLMELGVRDPSEGGRHFLSQLEMAGIRPFPGMRVFPVKETGGRGRPRGSKKQYFDPSERPFKCKLCGKGFRQKAVLMQHDRTHTNERPYSCTECEKAFRQQTHLVQHMRIHTGFDRPFSCTECDKSFRQKTHLIQHIRIHSGDDRPYSCTECSKAFRQKTHLIQHFLIHTGEKPYDCQYCSRSFRQKAILDQHERIHTGEKPYQCTLCEKAFRQKAILDTHLRKHMGIKPFLCYICEKAFSQKSILNEHLKLHAASEEGGMKLALKKRGRKKKSEMDRLSYLMKPDFGNPNLPGTSAWLHNMSPRSVASSSDSGLPSPPGHVAGVSQQPHYGESVDMRERDASRVAERTTWDAVRTPESSSSVPDSWQHRATPKGSDDKTEQQRYQTSSHQRHGPLNQVSSSPAQQHQANMEEGRQSSFYPPSAVSTAMSPPHLPPKQNYSYSPPGPLPFYTSQGPPQLQALGLHRMAPYLHGPTAPNPSNPTSALDPRIPFTTHLQMLKK